jgi:hypothetical protein
MSTCALSRCDSCFTSPTTAQVTHECHSVSHQMGSSLGSGAHPTSYPVDTGVPSPGVQRPECEANSSSPSTSKANNVWSYSFTLP